MSVQPFLQNLIQFAWHINTKKSDIPEDGCALQPTMQPITLDIATTIDYFNFKKPKDKRSLPRMYRTRPDPFEHVWDEIQLKLELQPESYAREIIEWLSVKYPSKYSKGQIRTLQRRIHEWRLRSNGYETRMSDLMI